MKNTVIALLLAILVVSLVNLLGTFGLLGGSKGGATGSASAPYEYAVYTVDEIGAMVLKLIETEEGLKPNEKGEMAVPRAALLPQNSLPRIMNYLGRERWELVDIKTNGLHIFRRRTGDKLPPAPRLITQGPPAGSAPAAPAAPQGGAGAPSPVQTAPGSGAPAPAPAAPAAGN